MQSARRYLTAFGCDEHYDCFQNPSGRENPSGRKNKATKYKLFFDIYNRLCDWMDFN